jgi:cell division protein FtsZ
VAQTRVVGIGDGGISALEYAIAQKLQGVDYIAANTRDLSGSRSHTRIVLGDEGAAGSPGEGERAAEAQAGEIAAALDGAERVILIAALGGGTGTGATPLIARIARERGAVVTAVVSRPFTFEGDTRQRIAHAGLEQLEAWVDDLNVIVNDDLLQFMDQSDIPSIKALFELATRALAWKTLACIL